MEFSVIIGVIVESAMENLYAIVTMSTLELTVLSEISVLLIYALTDLHVLMMNLVIRVNVQNGCRENIASKPITVPVVLAKT